jgi:heme/copper-type cytochrome/quinol oxidase subunit 2
MKRQLGRQVTVWAWLGRVAPLTALFALALELIYQPTGWLEYIVIGVAISFGVTAFIWWWWVIYAVKDLNEMLQSATDRFDIVIFEIKKVHKELSATKRKR